MAKNNGFRPELMETDYDCGVAALLSLMRNTTHPDATRDQVKQALSWIERRSNRSDTVWQHLKAHRRLEFPTHGHARWTVAQLRAVVLRVAPVVCLLRVGRFAWHWAVLVHAVPGQLGFAWGYDFELKWIDDEEFLKTYWMPSRLARVLACDRYAYTISESGTYTRAPVRMRFTHWLYRVLLGRFF